MFTLAVLVYYFTKKYVDFVLMSKGFPQPAILNFSVAVKISPALHMYVTVFDPCDREPCQNNGVCISRREGFVCMCKGNFGGTKCQCK